MGGGGGQTLQTFKPATELSSTMGHLISINVSAPYYLMIFVIIPHVQILDSGWSRAMD